ncbi:hypothetical protein P152DRAFT_456971 [Eremomyces bilateralis CBS 781.70]|uniref:Actin-crosslinking protein n=1 Tax=Eremomyces bilateralis CBS 781.70 TaxID=1392243 RepID=A0A6G1G6C5_9PEZI|nr:uncharacterized protein P152DRAFT_456971 [Eremomyces bilateralis CBS 781.70]KAF1813588.1 hypothetical protein P152DRAFT_456971 [Eremomyces bilateralis CBS 781.70]
MVKPLTFKGDKKTSSKKRKRDDAESSRTKGPNEQSVSKEESNVGDDTWVAVDSPSDISGPVIFILPTSPPSLLSSDAAGSIFNLKAENIIEGNPKTVEPDDVRQVWIASRVAGREEFSFKSSHGKYLSSDKYGLLSAMREAVGLEEGWAVQDADTPSRYVLRTGRSTFLAARDDIKGKTEIRADGAEKDDHQSAIIVRMQARFKPRLQVAKTEKAYEKISWRELEELVGRKLNDDEVRTLKKARRHGGFHEALLDVKVRGKHDKFA